MGKILRFMRLFKNTEPEADAGVLAELPMPPDVENPILNFYRRAEKGGTDLAAHGITVFDDVRARTYGEYLKAAATALHQPAFDPDHNEQDRLLLARTTTLQGKLQSLRQEESHVAGLRRQLEVSMPGKEKAPSPSPFLLCIAIAVVGLSLGLSMAPLFEFDDVMTSQVAALAAGGLTAAMLILALFND